MSKMGNFTVNFTHFSHSWLILPITLGKRNNDLNGLKKPHHENGQNSLKLLSVHHTKACVDYNTNLCCRNTIFSTQARFQHKSDFEQNNFVCV
jgi:hypothetical protein